MQAEAGEDSALHVIVFDEIDAFTRERGSLSGDTSGIRDSVVNQLLAKMDGVDQLENVLIIGLTNRPELIDAALLRPGRLEVQVEVMQILVVMEAVRKNLQGELYLVIWIVFLQDLLVVKETFN